ncbi:potassium transporter Kef [Vibrio inusitatus NBRC 102082]|uniref:Potassium transporter Kef n=1 Tax=Vibrio inusitatus NBRC 102082 TaxID=1219070 RepID=A0A4Y3HQY6_9VIBR|nr:cation:proton antiporter family protein [Vibrio inusitatus]GEA49455.1 potassium transporter Kef [Vibrio inusitatus NBRC 102082]
MDIMLILGAFVAGFVAQRCNLPPLVGFLLAGFTLNAFGFESNDAINQLADLGVTLLLFTIGLKLDIKVLLSKEIWAGATLHNLASTAFFTFCLVALQVIGVSLFADMSFEQLIILGFALSFSSTVFAIKALQDNGEINSVYGTLAIGILVMQDIFAVAFLTVSTGKVPEWYAIFLFALPLVRPLFYKVLDKVGHGELLVLGGIFFALVVGAGLFELVGVKGDLGALILGMLLAGHSKSSELSKSLFNLKEMFLVCFFLNIGLSEQPTLAGLILALVFMLLLPVKGILYYLILDRFKFRVRTSLLASLTLFNFSEFGLIVGGLAYKQGWISGDIMVSIALAVSISFIIAAPLNRFSNSIYRRSASWLKEHSDAKINIRDQFIGVGQAQVMVLGMGRIGTGAYDELTERHGDICLGIEIRNDTADHHQRHARNTICGDVTDSDFWERIQNLDQIKLVLLAIPNNQGNRYALEQLRLRGYQGKIAAIAEYQDQVEQFIELGADAAFDIYREAGSGFARHVCDTLNPNFTTMK